MKTADVPFPRSLIRFPTLRQSLLGAFDLCALEAHFEAEHGFMDPLDVIERMEWGTHPQGRGQLFHRWAGRLMNILELSGAERLHDEVKCPSCDVRPEGMFEGNACPHCGTSLVSKALTDIALDLLIDVCRQDDVEPWEVVTVPQSEKKDLEWIVCKFAKEQRFKIENLIAVEERLHGTIEYPNGHGGFVERVLTGQLDALFSEKLEEQEGFHATVLDYKDTWAIPGSATISTEGYWQQRFYAWLVMKTYEDVHKVTLREVYVRFSSGESGEENHRTATITRDRLPLIEKQLAVVAEGFDRAWEAFEIAQEMEAEYDGAEAEAREELAPKLAVARKRARALARPTPGGHCNYCLRPGSCPIIDSVRVHGSVHTPEDAERIAGELVVAKRVVKAREEALRGYLERPETERAATVRKDTEGLRKYKDRPPGLPEGVPVKNAKGDKAFAFVEGKRTAAPSQEMVAEALAAAAAGVPVDAGSLYRSGASSTLRLTEPAVPTDEAAEPDPRVEEALARSMERLEASRAI